MEPVFVLTSEMFSLFVLPVLIFCARILDVTLSTLRIVFVSKGMKHLSPVIGFFEILIWLLAIGQIMKNLGNFVNYVAYAGGFSAGTYVGLWVENRLAMGNVIIRIITKKNPSKLVEYLRSEGYGVTVVDAMGRKSSSKIILTVVKRKDLKETARIIKKFNPNAFYSVEDIRYVNRGKFPYRRENELKRILLRKGK